jgi:WG containing repeat
MATGLKKKNIIFIITCIIILVISLIGIFLKLSIEYYNQYSEISNNKISKTEFKEKDNKNIEINKELDTKEFKNNIYAFEENGLYGFKNSYGEIVINPKYDFADNSSEGLASVYIDGKYGYIDSKDNLIIENKYAYAQSFTNGLAIVDFEDGKAGIVDKNGSEIFSTDKYKLFQIVDNYIAVGNNDSGTKMGYLDIKGNPLGEIKYNSLWEFVNGIARVEYEGKYGYINDKGQEIIPLIYDYADNFKNGYAIVNDGESSKLIDINGREVSINSLSFKNTYSGFVDEIIVGQDINTLESVVLNKDFKELYRLPTGYTFTGEAKSGLSVFYNDNNGLSFMDSKGKQKFEIDNADIWLYDYDVTKDYFVVEKYDKDKSVGVVNINGEEVIPLKYSNIEKVDKFFICTIEGIFGDKFDIYYNDLKIINNSIKADYIFMVGDGVLSIEKDDEIYYLNKHGQKF